MNTRWLLRFAPGILGLAAISLEHALPSHRKTVQLALLILALLWAISRVPTYVRMTRGMILGAILSTVLCATALVLVWQFLPMPIIPLAAIAVVIVIVFAFVAVKIAEVLGEAVENHPRTP